MSEVLCKTNLVSSWHYNHRRRRCNLDSGVSYFCSLKLKSRSLKSQSQSPLFSSDFHGKRIVVEGENGFPRSPIIKSRSSIVSQTGPRIGKAHKWWEKGLQPNMKEVTSADDLVDSLQNAGDKLLVVDFFSPGCGGCKALHPKICQLAEMNPDAQFLQVNYEEHKSMCYSLNVHVLPFFRFYRGAHGRVCSFSCTNATIKKFKDALAKHGPDRCSLGLTKGLEEKELLALGANRDLSFNYTPKPVEEVITASDTKHSHPESEPLALPTTIIKSTQDSSNEKAMVTSGR